MKPLPRRFSAFALILVLSALFPGASRPALAALVAFGYDHTAIGNAQLNYDAASGTLNVSNLGSSGNDGVSIDPAGSISNGADFDISSPSLATPGTFVQVQGVGTVAGAASQPVFTSQYTATDATHVTAKWDATAISPASLTAEVYQDGAFFESVSGLPSVLSGALAFAAGPRVDTWDLSCCFPPDFSIDGTFASASFADLGSGNTLFSLGAGNYQIFFVAQGGSPVSDISAINVTSTAPEFAITGEDIQDILPVPEPSTLALMTGGILALGIYLWRRRPLQFRMS